ncbi:MAG: MFS transporter, partial [Firmicutes bacterium]|nr:MFS transporter [Bacillota bacterium]
EHTVMIGAACALCAPVIRVFVRARDTRSPHLFRRPSKTVTRMGLYAILFGCATGAFAPFATLILQGHYGIGDRAAATVSALSLLFTSVGSFSVTPFVRRIGRRRTTTRSFWAGIVVSLILAWHFPYALPFILLLLARTAIFSIPGSIIDATFLEWTEPTMHVQMFGVRVFGTSIGSAVGSYLGGALLDRDAIGAMLILSAIAFAGAWFYLRTLWNSRTQGHATPDQHAS